MPRVTVIIATYNWATVLPYSIGSALDQTFEDFELLVVGDGCTDESADLVGGMDDHRLHWVDLGTNTGNQAGPNREGLRRAHGEIIAYLSHDDVWLPHHLEVLVEAIDAGARFAHATTLLIAPDYQPGVWPAPGWQFARGSGMAPTMVVHERALVDEVGTWKLPQEVDTLDVDSEFWQRLAAVQPPAWVRRVTSVRLPAVRRRDVYRTRPFHEQAYWLERIRSADDPERSVLDACHEPYVFATARDETIPDFAAIASTAERATRRRTFKGLDS